LKLSKEEVLCCILASFADKKCVFLLFLFGNTLNNY